LKQLFGTRLRQLWVPKLFRLPKPEFTEDQLDLLEDLIQPVHSAPPIADMEKIAVLAALVESVIIWRAQHIAWNVDIRGAESLLFRMIYKEGVRNPQAMDLLARIYFQQGKYEKAKNLWDNAAEIQPGSSARHPTASAMSAIARSPASAVARYRFGVMLRGAALVVLLCLGVVPGVGAFRRWPDGPAAAHNLSGRFHYDTVTRNMTYAPAVPPVESLLESLAESSVGTAPGEIVPAIGLSANTGGNGLSYRVNAGDNLWVIARRVYGYGAAWKLLAEANGISDPSKLSVGQALSLPIEGEHTETGDGN
jgi:tetratricopeptide (TPR) repeat protein